MNVAAFQKALAKYKTKCSGKRWHKETTEFSYLDPAVHTRDEIKLNPPQAAIDRQALQAPNRQGTQRQAQRQAALQTIPRQGTQRQSHRQAALQTIPIQLQGPQREWATERQTVFLAQPQIGREQAERQEAERQTALQRQEAERQSALLQRQEAERQTALLQRQESERQSALLQKQGEEKQELKRQAAERQEAERQEALLGAQALRWVQPIEDGWEVSQRKITLMGIHHTKRGDRPQDLIVHGINLTDYTTLQVLEPNNTLLLYNENLEQFLDKSDINAGGGNGIARQWRIDSANSTDKFALGIPTMSKKGASIEEIKKGIDSAFVLLRAYLQKEKVDLIIWTSNGDLEIGTDIAGDFKSTTEAVRYIRTKMKELKIEFGLLERYSSYHANGYKRLLAQHLDESELKRDIEETLNPRLEYQAVTANLQAALQDPFQTENKKECLLLEKEILEKEYPFEFDESLARTFENGGEILVPPAGLPDVLDIDSDGDGHCFFRSVYISLVAKQLMPLISTTLGIQNSDEDTFVREIRRKIVDSEEYPYVVTGMLHDLVQPGMVEDDQIFEENMDEFVEYLRILGFRADIVQQKQYIITDLSTIRNVDQFKITANLEKNSYATPIEIECMRILLEKCGVTLQIDPAQIKQPFTIVVKKFGDHYHSFVEQDKLPVLQKHFASFSQVTQAVIRQLQ